MSNKSNNQNVISPKSTGKSDQVLPSAQSKPDEVSWVLEHVSSPFRWEVLEASPLPPTSSAPDIQNHRGRD